MNGTCRTFMFVLSVCVAIVAHGQQAGGQSTPPANPEGTSPTSPQLNYAEVVTLKCLNVGPFVVQPLSGQTSSTVATIGPLNPSQDFPPKYSCARNPIGPVGFNAASTQTTQISNVTETVWTKTDSETMYKNLQKEVLAAISKAVKDSFVSKEDLKAAVAEEIRKEHDLLKAEILAEISVENQSAKSKGQTNPVTTLSLAATQ